MRRFLPTVVPVVLVAACGGGDETVEVGELGVVITAETGSR